MRPGATGVAVNARVIRDEGDRGTVLQFFELDEATQEYLSRMEKFLPILAMRDGQDDDGITVCEMLDHSLR